MSLSQRDEQAVRRVAQIVKRKSDGLPVALSAKTPTRPAGSSTARIVAPPSQARADTSIGNGSAKRENQSRTLSDWAIRTLSKFIGRMALNIAIKLLGIEPVYIAPDQWSGLMGMVSYRTANRGLPKTHGQNNRPVLLLNDSQID